MQLAKRLTHKYVGSWKHEDEWLDIGDAQVIAQSVIEITDEEDMCEPTKQVLFLDVATHDPQRPSDVASALHDVFTSHGCSHDYDCCGCRSYHGRAEHLAGATYRVVVTSSRNY